MAKYNLSINVEVETNLPFSVDTLHAIEDSIQSVTLITQDTLNELNFEINDQLSAYNKGEFTKDLKINISDVNSCD
jgi:hypothetical protein